MLSTDNVILNILKDEKEKGNEILQPFNISHPSKRVAMESNSIFVACVSSENQLEGFDFERFKDLVEILIVTKQLDYNDAISLIKTVTYEICHLIHENSDKFPLRPVIRSINPEFNRDYVLTRGHIMVQCITEPVDWNVSDDEYWNVCNVIIKKIMEE